MAVRLGRLWLQLRVWIGQGSIGSLSLLGSDIKGLCLEALPFPLPKERMVCRLSNDREISPPAGQATAASALQAAQAGIWLAASVPPGAGDGGKRSE